MRKDELTAALLNWLEMSGNQFITEGMTGWWSRDGYVEVTLKICKAAPPEVNNAQVD